MPEPSRLVLLEQLPNIASGTKVRFLGCVHQYHEREARLVLRSRYPAYSHDSPCALINIDMVLENASHDLLETGAWLNVLGYVEAVEAVDPSALPLAPVDEDPKLSQAVPVRATMVWSAGPIRVDRYEGAVKQYQDGVLSG